MDAAERYERLTEEPPSAKLVCKMLELHGPLTQGELKEESLLPARTVTYALSRLREENIVESRRDPEDPRRDYHSLLPVEAAEESTGDGADTVAQPTERPR
ncbi:hypothetical protein C474_16544 [Halogeometricum pallidum JCM 14848]|uniref:HTH marR-type domain-containing protein n=1 Tax=Halogeometricum pallidum JCM 14848 TaxID=1227487 RepID=M0CVU2_HALPD|nr:helix-turn-helix domain-containing protein [Halogeometricum pallidum]ELZ27366.1 hypothetical protein C474_16544 [Halogeometricum pallidum JCM 14848]